jgi:hypothetical protein
VAGERVPAVGSDGRNTVQYLEMVHDRGREEYLDDDVLIPRLILPIQSDWHVKCVWRIEW